MRNQNKVNMKIDLNKDLTLIKIQTTQDTERIMSTYRLYLNRKPLLKVWKGIIFFFSHSDILDPLCNIFKWHLEEQEMEILGTCSGTTMQLLQAIKFILQVSTNTMTSFLLTAFLSIFMIIHMFCYAGCYLLCFLQTLSL